MTKTISSAILKTLILVSLFALSGCLEEEIAGSGEGDSQTQADDKENEAQNSPADTDTTPESEPAPNVPDLAISDTIEPEPITTDNSDPEPESDNETSVPDSATESDDTSQVVPSFNDEAFWASSGDGIVTLEWDAIPEAAQYNLYQAKEPFDDFQNYAVYQDSRLMLDVSSAHSIGGLTNYRYNYFVLTAEVAGQEYPVGDPIAVYARDADEPTAREVRRLELINRARKDPTAEANRYGLANLNEGLDPGTLTHDPKPPLAFNMDLMDASRLHSAWMLQNNVFSHTGANGSSVGDRAEDAGYLLVAPAAVGENLAWQGTSGNSINLTAAIEGHHEGLFLSSGHRANMLKELYREVGIGQQQGDFTHNSQVYRASMLTNVYGASSGRYFISGVAFQVTDGEGLYQPGSALQDVTVQVDRYRYAPTTSGTYSILLPPGSYSFSVTVSGQQVAAPETVTISGQNVKRDIVRQSGVVGIRAF